MYFEDLANERRSAFFGAAKNQLLDQETSIQLHKSHSAYTASDLVDLIPRLAFAIVATEEGRRFLTFGAARRLKMIRHAYLSIVAAAPPDRCKPLGEGEVADLTRDLNVIYFNIVGLLDNLAWAALHEKAPSVIATTKPLQIGLFKPSVSLASPLAELRPLIERHSEWEKGIRAKRDPVAHRIPLSMPPAILTPEEGEEYRRRWSKSQQHKERREFEEAERTLESLDEIGTFNPVFWHEAGQGTVPLYPTVSDDLQHIKELSYGVLDFLEAAQQ
jgi:hypothetical protein